MSHAIPHAGKKQQTGSWNSGAVALPTLAMANVTLFFYTVGSRNGCAKRRGQANTFNFKGVMVNH